MWLMRPNRYGVFNFSDVDVVYSVRQFNDWSNAVFKLRRSSDDTLAFVFFNSSGEIDDTSLISITSNTTPDTSPTVTLSTWYGASTDLFVREWIGQEPDDNISVNKTLGQTTFSRQPKIFTSSAFFTKNGKLAVNFNNANVLVATDGNIAINSGNNYTICTISHCIDSGAVDVIYSSAGSIVDRLLIINDRSAGVNASQIIASGTNAFANNLASQNTADQKLQSCVGKSSLELTSYFNAVIQTVDAAWTGTYTNNDFRLGAQAFTNQLNGGIQEVIVYASDKTDDLTDIHGNMNAFYSIF